MRTNTIRVASFAALFAALLAFASSANAGVLLLSSPLTAGAGDKTAATDQQPKS